MRSSCPPRGFSRRCESRLARAALPAAGRRVALAGRGRRSPSSVTGVSGTALARRRRYQARDECRGGNRCPRGRSRQDRHAGEKPGARAELANEDCTSRATPRPGQSDRVPDGRTTRAARWIASRGEGHDADGQRDAPTSSTSTAGASSSSASQRRPTSPRWSEASTRSSTRSSSCRRADPRRIARRVAASS
jgi:hypothetical protein